MTALQLNRMGIVRWRQRRPLPGAASQTVAVAALRYYHLLRGERVIGGLLIAADVDTAGHEDKMESLIDAMLAAIQLKRIAIKSYSSLPEQKNVLIMGAGLAQQVEGLLNVDAAITILRHPLELVQQPQYKREAWLALQKFDITLS